MQLPTQCALGIGFPAGTCKALAGDCSLWANRPTWIGTL